MRPAGLRDLRDAARALLFVPSASRLYLGHKIVREARAADAFVKRAGRLHPDFGDGSLGARARMEPLAAERWINDAEFADCLCDVLEALRYAREHSF